MSYSQRRNDSLQTSSGANYSHMILGGALVREEEWGKRATTQATVATISPNDNVTQTSGDDGWRHTAKMSMEGMFLPFSTEFEVNHLAGTSTNRNRSVAMTSYERPYTVEKTDGVMKSLADWWHVGSGIVTSATLNPFAKGHHVSMLARNEQVTDLSVSAEGYAGAPKLGYVPNAQGGSSRPVGLRGPMILTGWGYDSQDLPVPNAKMDAPSKVADWQLANFGRPKGEGSEHKNPELHFVGNHLKRINEWKTGPIDLRWDRDRKVWVGGKFNGVYLSKATKCILPQAGIDGLNTFNFGVGGNVNTPGRLYRNVCPQDDCTFDSYFPTSIHYSDIEIYDPEDREWCGSCQIVKKGDAKVVECTDMTQRCQTFYDAVIIRSVDHIVSGKTKSDCGDKFSKAGANPMARRAGDPCHGWGSSIQGETENINKRVGKDFTYSEQAKALLYKKIFVENPLNQGLMLGDSFLSYDTGRRIVYEYTRAVEPTCNGGGTPITVKEVIPVHVILQAEFYGLELVTRSGCEGGEVTACTRKIFAQGFSTVEDCGPDDDYPFTVMR